ncbi:XRE family transcriptional regulator [Cytophaga hutchinsonii]|uniref:Zinc-related peptidase n=1 Tax=Cytophaga hutchinsonii (strain ATCC 33406 / DSM 1761 / CIP 103989 / NBRC 15051 / NCIMB 9469 / D465) TaxID=269798 RepID=A0A6N4SM43_CYTH3|nr:XRE family transcriptional regulator [Cytophaga hutchinsonii]ABG57328.1 zinc-related peptidase [Cytophaga hutchinsonii ATCC 33406]SFX46463.1 Zn-dependent peptidase ImmA, M78 family [Cytophaga hutchinsonii ATCC 33406]
MPIDRVSLGNKLSRCRQNLDLELSDVSKKIGLPLERLDQIEKGIKEPTGDEILIFADFYRQDYKYFISNERLSASEQVEILYRKFGDIFSKEDRWAIQEFIFLCENEQDILNYLDFNKLNFIAPKYSHVYKSQGTETAEKLRHFLGYKNEELYSDLYSEFRKIGLHVFRRKLNNSQISGLFIKHPVAGKCILVNYDDDTYRQNFTLCHEVCHALLDDEHEINISFKSENDYREIRANTFAGSFLIPLSYIEKFKLLTWTEELVLKIAIQLKVNIQTLLIVLKSNNCINQNLYDKFIKLKISRKDKDDYELKGVSPAILSSKKLLLERGLSMFYVKKCHEAYVNGHISSGKLAANLLVDESELPFILDLFKLKLNYEH